MTNPRKPRLVAAAALATSLVAAFAALGGVGVAESAISAAQYQYGKKKVTICHKGKKTIRVGERAAAAHVRRHHDTVGKCVKAKHKKHKKLHKSDRAEHKSKNGDHKSENAKKAGSESKLDAKSKVNVKVKNTDGEKSEARERDKPGNDKGNDKDKGKDKGKGRGN